jgi:lipoyl synthase
MMSESSERLLRKPSWLKIKLPLGKNYTHVKSIVDNHGLHTICSSGNCPNLGECWGRGTATFMILGNVCTRSCKFCAVETGIPLPPDPKEPNKLAQSVKLMGLKHCVITSVDRDDLEDKGAEFWAACIREVKKVNPTTTMEVLIPDFDGRSELIDLVAQAKPDIISHNMETVRRITPAVRSRAKYDLSLEVIRSIAYKGVTAKSGIVVGISETEQEVFELMDDLIRSGCQVFTIGQYLQPTRDNFPVKEYVHPDQFERYRQTGLEKGFRFVESSPLTRSSYHAEMHATNF